TTNNRMELLAVIKGLEELKVEGIPVTIYSDSKYVVDAVTKGWIWNWQKKGFKDKKNADLWKKYIPLHLKYKPRFVWVRGHAGNVENERCDRLAVAAAESGQLRWIRVTRQRCPREYFKKIDLPQLGKPSVLYFIWISCFNESLRRQQQRPLIAPPSRHR